MTAPLEPGVHAKSAAESGKGSVATALVQFVLKNAILARTPVGEALASIVVADHLENWPLRSQAFRSWLYKLYFAQERRAPNDQSLEEALRTLEGYAGEGEVYELFVRVADVDEGSIYLDLANEAWEVVEIDAAGWRVVASDETPIHFSRPQGMKALPHPQRGGSIDELRGFVNVGSDDDFTLLKAWLVGALRPRGPYPILGIIGQQGSAKSSFCRFVREIIDPNEAPIRAQPRDERDLMIAAKNGWIVGYDNLSGLSSWLSDALCRLATGSGFATRRLYTDAEEAIFKAARPTVLNGIDEIASRGDLQDRSITLTLPVISDKQRRTETELWAAFREAHPRILGALLDAVSAALRNEAHVQLERLPRMADFAKWVAAAEPALGNLPRSFIEAYDSNRAAGSAAVLDGSFLAIELLKLVETGPYRGTASDLLGRLNEEVEEGVRRERSWPQNPRALSSALRRIAPSLLGEGVEVDFVKLHAGRRFVSVRRVVEAVEAAGGAAHSETSPPIKPIESEHLLEREAAEAVLLPKEIEREEEGERESTRSFWDSSPPSPPSPPTAAPSAQNRRRGENGAPDYRSGGATPARITPPANGSTSGNGAADPADAFDDWRPTEWKAWYERQVAASGAALAFRNTIAAWVLTHTEIYVLPYYEAERIAISALAELGISDPRLAKKVVA